MKHRKLTYLVILLIMITAASAYSKTNSSNGSLRATEVESVFSQTQNIDGCDMVRSTAFDRSGTSFSSNILENLNPQASLQHPIYNLVIKQSLIILENQKRASLRFLSYLKN